MIISKIISVIRNERYRLTVFSESASSYCEPFVCSVVLGDDIVCRIGLSNIHDLKAKIFSTVRDLDIPKVWEMKCIFKMFEYCTGWPKKKDTETVKIRFGINLIKIP